jgi:cytochrome oxidase Cu insertion factor (SCO1/SenC/PrrC family)
MNTFAVRFWLILAVCLVAIYGSFVAARRVRDPNSSAVVNDTAPSAATARLDSRPLQDFTLTDQDGQPFHSESLKGKVWVASFFFTNCPGVCLQLNRTLAAIQETDPHQDIRYISITCDPENDTPEALKKYAEFFKADPARWTFLTGDMQTIRRIGQDFFKISVDKAVHTDRACVVDRLGKVRGRFRLTEDGQVEMLKRLLAMVDAQKPDANPAPETAAADAPSATAGSSNSSNAAAPESTQLHPSP